MLLAGAITTHFLMLLCRLTKHHFRGNAGAIYRANLYADEPSAAPPAPDIVSQAIEQAEVEQLYSLHDAAARSAATAAAVMNMPGCNHHVSSAVMVAELCEDPAGEASLCES